MDSETAVCWILAQAVHGFVQHVMLTVRLYTVLGFQYWCSIIEI